MKVMVYRWGTNFTQQQIDPLLKKYQNLVTQNFENENFFDVLELAGNHKQWTGLYNSNHIPEFNLNEHFFYTDNITFNTISLFKKFKPITKDYTDINFYGFIVNNGIKNNIVGKTNE